MALGKSEDIYPTVGLGIIIDVPVDLSHSEVLSKYCQNCAVTGRDMEPQCAKFAIWQKDMRMSGTKILMEPLELWRCIALIMWRRSISDCQPIQFPC
ncbi:hypothetical protein TNIN_95141 [Trichonephila inaurata madagascariensis]|uniref:Uncharacterized protein n=1 Tax=Trichonephila inaurata madagascariensis TaxID=2747483 RepID=A0A8X7CMN3_9ARAC|nr:hypothetical protein TNIN_95141 [Trichonephila inaurata madagascariensis]